MDRLLEVMRSGRLDMPGLPGWAALEGVRGALAEERERLGEGGEARKVEELASRAAALGAELATPRPRRVVNATGIVLHTNLGRAPLSPGAAAAVAEAAARYGDLELDVASGRRGNRLGRLAEKLVLASGAEAATAVNNNAAALLLAVNTLARGREVVVSRGELVEIGGSFRVPEILERAGVELVEVGTTNRTHAADYVRAIGPRTALLLKIHRSNFELRGFVTEVSLAELVAIGRERGLPVVEDLGSGTLVEIPGLPPEAFVPARVRQGPDVICFSGDKLLGGPQAGILLGRAEPIRAMCANPMARALRLDKLTLAALGWTLDAVLDGRARDEIPVLQQLTASAEQLEARARALAERLARALGASVQVDVAPDRALAGGGSLPGFELDSWVVTLSGSGGPVPLAARLRAARVPVLARVRDDRVALDVRTLLPGDEDAIEEALASVAAPSAIS